MLSCLEWAILFWGDWVSYGYRKVSKNTVVYTETPDSLGHSIPE